MMRRTDGCPPQSRPDDGIDAPPQQEDHERQGGHTRRQ